MPQIASDLLSSKKFLFTLLVSVTLIVLMHYGVVGKEEGMHILTILLPAYVGAQGLADFGKHAVMGLPSLPEPQQPPRVTRIEVNPTSITGPSELGMREETTNPDLDTFTIDESLGKKPEADKKDG